MKNKIVIGITLDDVIRDFSSQFIKLYNDVYKDRQIDNDIDMYDLLKYFKDKESALDFIYSEVVLELFGLGEQTSKNCLFNLNKIKEIFEENGFELIIISNEFGKSISATLHFLGANMCQFNKIIFTKTNQELFDNCDYIVTTNYLLVDNFKDENDRIILIDKPYNKHVDIKYKLSNVNKLPNLIEELKIIKLQ
jgi:5'(3')-deoxyribonucleotidase